MTNHRVDENIVLNEHLGTVTAVDATDKDLIEVVAEIEISIGIVKNGPGGTHL